MSTPGLPIGLQQPRRVRQERVFQHIPRLRELLPNGGAPGIVYVQALVSNMKWAAERQDYPEYLTAIRNSAFYTIRGPRGEAQMALLGSGEPILGASPEGGERHFFTDVDVEDATGLVPAFPIDLRPERRSEREEVESAQGRDEQDREGHARVQTRHAPQRIEQGSEGEEPQAGDRDRDERSAKKKVKKPRPNLKGHNHPAQFGRLSDGCPGCDAVRTARENG